MAGITSESMMVPGSHVHEISTNTTFDNLHIHRTKVRTSTQIPIGNNKHVHFIRGTTTIDDGHSHDIEIITLI